MAWLLLHHSLFALFSVKSFETSWQLKKRQVGGSNNNYYWVWIESGPPDSFNYAANNRYIGVYCLTPGKYKFIIRDLFGDGICCDYGKGNYAGYLGGSSRIFSSPSTGDLEWAKRTHTFDIAPKTAPPTRAPTNKPTVPYQPKTTSSCSSAQRRAKIEIKTDKYGQDTSWMMVDSQTETRIIESTKNYGKEEEDVVEVCLANGRSYEFIIRDQWGDGMVSGNWPRYTKHPPLPAWICPNPFFSLFPLHPTTVLQIWRRILQGLSRRKKRLG